MAKVQCFNCEEQYFPGHRCKGKLSRLNTEQDCLTEMVDVNPRQEPTVAKSSEDIEISLHALSG